MTLLLDLSELDSDETTNMERLKKSRHIRFAKNFDEDQEEDKLSAKTKYIPKKPITSLISDSNKISLSSSSNKKSKLICKFI